MWYPAEQPRPRSVNLSGFLRQARHHESVAAPVDRRLRVLAWTGTVLLAATLAFLALAPRHLHPEGRHAGFFLLGREAFTTVLQAGGHAAVALPAGEVALASAATLAVWTSGFRRARRWQQFAMLVVGLLGAVAIVPVVVALAIAAVNLVIWLALLGLALVAAREVMAVAFDG
jgi:hypothetical protein